MTKALRMEMVTRDELALLEAVRNLRREEARTLSAPPRVFERGSVTKDEAAKLLGISRSDVDRISTWKGLKPGEGILPCIKGRVPLSEVRRALQRRRRNYLGELTLAAKQLVRQHDWGYLPEEDFYGVPYFGYGVRQVAERLGLTQAAVKRMMDSGEIFAWRTSRGGVFVSQAELDAHLAAQKAKAEPAAA